MRNMKKSRRLSSALIEKNSKLFQPVVFSSNSVKEYVIEKSKITGTWAESVDISSCASLLNTEKALYFKPIMITDSCSSIATKKQCNFLFFNIK